MSDMDAISPLDDIDRAILNLLQDDGRLANIDVAEKVGLSPSACLRRVRRLEDAGVIAGFVLLVDQHKIGRPVDVFVEISLDGQAETKLDEFERAVADCPEVMSCHLMAGEYDYILHLAVADMFDYERIHKQYLSRLPSVARLRSNFSIRTVYETTKHEL